MFEVGDRVRYIFNHKTAIVLFVGPVLTHFPKEQLITIKFDGETEIKTVYKANLKSAAPDWEV